MTWKQFQASKEKPLALLTERIHAAPPLDISEESDSEDEFPLFGDTDNETNEGKVSEISIAESEGCEMLMVIILTDANTDQLSAGSCSVKGKTICLFHFLFFHFIFIHIS